MENIYLVVKEHNSVKNNLKFTNIFLNKSLNVIENSLINNKVKIELKPGAKALKLKSLIITVAESRMTMEEADKPFLPSNRPIGCGRGTNNLLVVSTGNREINFWGIKSVFSPQMKLHTC